MKQSNRKTRRVSAATRIPFVRRKALTLAVCQGLVASAQAAIIVVDSNVDSASADGNCSLREAMDNANDDALTHPDCTAGSGADEIWLPTSQTITLTSALPTVISGLTIAGHGATVQRDTAVTCLIDGSPGAGEFRLFHISAAPTVTVSDLTLAHGCADGSRGGAILAQNTNLTLDQVTIRDNTAGSSGGGLYFTSSGSYALTVTDSSFLRNAGGYAGGGARLIAGTTTGNFTHTSFSENSAVRGGGLYNSGATLDFEASTFSNNSASNSGGAIHQYNGITTVTNSTLSGNSATAGSGGGIYQYTGTSTVTNSTLSANTSNPYGGGLFAAGGTLTVTNSSLVDNLATAGDQVGESEATVAVTRTVLVGSAGSNCDVSPLYGSDSLSTDSTCASAATLVTRTSLSLQPLADNGGPTLTHALGSGSVAIDAAGACGIATDQRGRGRPADGDGDGNADCDTGAFELIPQFTVVTAGDADNGSCTSMTCTLRDAMTAAQASAAEILVDSSLSGSTVTLSTPLPSSSSALTIHGSGLVVERSSSNCALNGDDGYGSEFRLLTASAALSVHDMVLDNGCADGAAGQPSRGGAIYGGSEVSLYGVTITNSSANEDGGGVFAAGDLTLESTILTGNTADNQGGGAHAGGTLTISNSTISGNGAEYGGGVSGSGLIEQSTIASNTAGNRGGGVRITGSTTIRNSTLSKNEATSGQGGGIHAGSPITVLDSTFVDNFAYSSGDQIFAGETTLSRTRTMFVSDGTDNCLNPYTAANLSGLYNLSTDSSCGANSQVFARSQFVLGPLADNGGSTQTHALGYGSIAVDAGGVACTPNDQRGLTRPIDGDGIGDALCDVGAFEAQAVSQPGPDFAVNALGDNFDGTCGQTGGECSLRDALAEANADTGASSITFDGNVFAPGSTVTLVNGELLASTSVTINGGGVTIERDTSSGQSCVLDGNREDHEFRVLRATSYLGLNNLTIQGGCADGSVSDYASGGGIHVDGPTISLNSVTLQDNSATLDGGAVYFVNGTQATLTFSSVSDNTALQEGGGLKFRYLTYSANIFASTFSGNSAARGGGLYVDYADAAIGASTFSGNSAGTTGGAVYLSASTLSAADATFFSNNGPAITAENTTQSTVALSRSIIAGTGTQCVNVSGSSTFGDNIATDATCGESTSATLASLNIQPLADNGGPTLTHALGFGSVALNTGNTSCSGIDQRGFTRPVESCDFGAFELQETNLQSGPNFEVNAADDIGDGICGADAGECTLRDAVLAANSNPDASIITFGPPLNESSTATLTQGPITALHELSIDAGFATIARDAMAGGCVIDGNQEAHEFRLFLNDGDLTLSSATLTGGCADGPSSVDQTGGGVYSRSGSTLSLNSATLTANTAAAGGAVAGNAATIAAADSTLRLNTATAFGGAIYGVFDTSVSLNQTTVERNDATVDGGGIFISGNTLSITGGSLGQNTAIRDGGGIAGNGTVITIDNGYIFNNSAGADGGLIHDKSGGSISLTNSYVTSHSADGNGGAIATGKGTGVSIENSTIRDASAGADGGALHLFGEPAERATLNLTQSSLFGNSATGAGGGIFGRYTDSYIDNSTLSGNSAAIGGGIDGNNSSTVTLLHATLVDNVASTGGRQVDGSETSFAVTRTLFVGDSGTNCALSGGPSLTSTDSLSTDSSCGPLVTQEAARSAVNLGELQRNGGTTLNHLPGPFSVAVDAAAGCSGTDQRGVARPQDADGAGTDNCDLGAVEVQNTLVMAVDDSATTDQDTTATGSVTDNDIDAADDDGGTLLVTEVNGSAGNLGMDVTAGVSSLSINADGSFNFDPSVEFDALDDGEQDSIAVDYTVSDGFATSGATLTITVNGLNDAPIAEATSATTTEDATVIQSFNATDIDDEPLTFTIDSQPGSGTVANNGDGTFTFDPDGAFEQLDDLESEDVTFTYTASDTDLSASATATVTVTGVNDAPVAMDDANTAVAGEILDVNAANGLLSNDTDIDGDILTVASTGMFTPSGGGSLTVNADGSFSFDPTGAAGNTVTFDYTASDGDLEDTARLTIAISSENEVNLSIAKSDGQDIVSPGDVLTYTITVLNEGPADVTGARVEDVIPAELLDAGWSCSPVGSAACNSSGDGDIDELVNIPAGDAVEFTLNAQVDPAVNAASVSNTATVTAPTGLTEVDPDDNSATDVTGTDLVFADSFEGLPMSKAFSPRTATMDAKALSVLPDDGRPVLVLRGIDRGTDDLAIALIHARRIGGAIQLRISRLEGGEWVIGEWTELEADEAQLRW